MTGTMTLAPGEARGAFISLEGIEGAGKSTAARVLCETLRGRGRIVTATREPGGTPLAERLRELALGRGDERVSAEVETLLMFAARGIHLDNLIRPALARGEWVVCDRFTDATRAYQGCGRGVDRQWIEAIAGAVQRGVEPDLTLWLDLPVEHGLQRARARREAAGEAVADRFEAETLEFFTRVRAGYAGLHAAFPQRVVRIDAALDAQAVAAQVVTAVDSRLGAWR